MITNSLNLAAWEDGVVACFSAPALLAERKRLTRALVRGMDFELQRVRRVEGVGDPHAEFGQARRKLLSVVRHAVLFPRGDDIDDAKLTMTFRYRNHRGESFHRTVVPVRVGYTTNEFHRGGNRRLWLLQAFDIARADERSFDLLEIDQA